ncbi:hypothetical protein P886_2364 [Alteromonadaceae bacterium 2753L.S.0a.02]|nr:hypothetical protein P886_2364 [Alteromonadaceae bacterium 2753L.S.0a.02]
MKFKFFYDRFDLPDIECEKSIYPISWVLTDNARPELCDEILEEIANFKASKSYWEMSYNKSVLCLSGKGATCIDAFNESVEYTLPLEKFESLIKKWKSFLSDRKESSQVNI